MPITIEHGPSAGMMALAGAMGGIGASREAQLARSAQITQAAMGIGARRDMQVQQLEAQRNMQMQQIEAQAARQKEAADTAYARTALATGLQEEIQERQFDNQMVKMQEAARLQAEQWDYQYTTKQRQEIARLNEADALVESDPQYADIRDQWKALSLQKRAGITPRPIPADPNKAVYPEGQGIGQSWKDPFGNIKTRKPDGEEVTQIKFPDTPEGIQRKHEQAMELKALEREVKVEDLRRAQEIKWAGEKVPITQEAIEGGFLGWGAQEAGQVGERFRTEAEIKALSRKYFGPRPGEEVTGVMEQPQSSVAEQRLTGPQELIKVTHAMQERGVLVPRESDANLPHFVGMATAFLRKMKSESERGRDISPYAEAIQEARIILSQHATREMQ